MAKGNDLPCPESCQLATFNRGNLRPWTSDGTEGFSGTANAWFTLEYRHGFCIKIQDNQGTGRLLQVMAQSYRWNWFVPQIISGIRRNSLFKCWFNVSRVLKNAPATKSKNLTWKFLLQLGSRPLLEAAHLVEPVGCWSNLHKKEGRTHKPWVWCRHQLSVWHSLLSCRDDLGRWSKNSFTVLGFDAVIYW
jgi:hypothetical protein